MKKLLSMSLLTFTSVPALAHSGHYETEVLFIVITVVAFYALKPLVFNKIKQKK